MKVILQTVTPLHVGTGKKISPFEYVVEDGKFIRINTKKFFDYLDKSKKEELLKVYESKNLLLIRNKTYEFYIRLSSDEKKELKIYSIGVDKTFQKIYDMKMDDKRRYNEANRLEVEEAIKNLEGFYIPGSSLKGAIRTIILFGLSRKHSVELQKFKEIFSQVENIPKNEDKVSKIRYLSRNDTNNRIEEELLGYDKIWKDPFRFLIVRDSKILGFEVGEVIKNYRLGAKGKLHTTREYIKEDIQVETEISFNQRLYELFKKNLDVNYDLGFNDDSSFKNYFLKISQEFLKDRLNKLEKLTIQKSTFLKSKKLNRGGRAELQMFKQLERNIEFIKEKIDSLHDNETIVSLGFGGGYIFKHLDDLLIPETCNFVANQLLNGFVKLTFTD